MNTRRGIITAIPAATAQEIEQLGIDAGLGYFWHNRPDLQHAALVKIAAQPQGRVTLAYNEAREIVGYVTMGLPDPDTRWGRDHIAGLYELGGIEVGRAWRGLGISRVLLDGMFDSAFDKAIVLATGYRWCWDVEATGKTIREYRDMLDGLFKQYGFGFFDTDEPNIAWYPDNALVVRIGKQVPRDLETKFRALLFENAGSDYVMSEFSNR